MVYIIRKDSKTNSNNNDSPKKIRPALSPETRENQMISLAIDLAEKQLIEGTASSQVISHYLKLGSMKDRLEREILEQQKELIVAKTENIKSAKKSEEAYKEVILALQVYGGYHNDHDDSDFD